jgi:hypothetical protein
MAQPVKYILTGSASSVLSLAINQYATLPPLFAVLFQFLVGEIFAQFVTSHGPSGGSEVPRVIFPPANEQTYNLWDIINITYWTPWHGGVNLSANCWPGTENDDPFDEVPECLSDNLFCSPCACQRPSCLKLLDLMFS